MVSVVSGKSGAARPAPTSASSGIRASEEIRLPATMIADWRYARM